METTLAVPADDHRYPTAIHILAHFCVDSNPYQPPASKAEGTASRFRLLAIGFAILTSCIGMLAFASAGFIAYKNASAMYYEGFRPQTYVPLVVLFLLACSAGLAYSARQFLCARWSRGIIISSVSVLTIFPGLRILLNLLYGPSGL